MTKIIAVANQKGGVGKTTSTINLAFALARRGKTVLAIDADPQASLTFYFGQDERILEENRRTLFYSLVQDRLFSDLLIEGNPALIASSIMLSKADRELMLRMRYTDTLLREKLRELGNAYDVILIDCPPTLTLLTSNALAAAHAVLIPVKTDLLSILGIPLLLEEIEQVRARANPNLTIWGVLPTLYNTRFTNDNEALEALKGILAPKGIRVFPPIPRSTGYDRASGEGVPTVVLSPNAPGVEVYYQLADEVLNYD